MPAHPLASTGKAISITASSLAWAHGPAGAIATAGAVIASPTVVEEAITEEVVLQPIADTEAAHR
jgi:hypothetical protein